jgi:hypothetical protein
VITTGNSVTDDLNLVSAGPYYGALIQCDLDISSGSPNGDVVIEVFGSPDGGTSDDTIALKTIRVPFTATGNKKASFTIYGIPFCSVKVANSTAASCTYIGRYAGLKQSSA